MSRVLISGTSSGIGFQTAVELGRAGHTVFATMRDPGRGAALQAIVDRERLPISISQMDVDSDESVDAATSAIRARSGSIDVLVNNAGIERAGSIEGMAFADFKATMETNYFGALRVIRAWLPDMRQRQSGCIINVTSVAGRIACSPLSAYSASKFALEALSEALAQEVRPFGVRVAIVQPGIIDTAMARRIEDVPADATYPQVRRFGQMFEASLDKPTPPALVAAMIREIIESGTLTLRHPVGPDAEGFLGWRASLSDQDWVEWGALPDDAWYERVAADFGLDARPKSRPAAGAPGAAIRAGA
jgi:NAD(P)-dependent dehydrogenase (short-subunit alcohol dehydrogenase family)